MYFRWLGAASMSGNTLTWPNQPDRGQPRPALGFAQTVMNITTFTSLADRHLTGRGASSGGRWTTTFEHSPRLSDNMKSKLIGVLGVVIMLVSGCATSRSAPEYKVLQGSLPSTIEKDLNELGTQGWVVVSSTSPAPYKDNTAMIVIILKRDRK